MSSLPGPPITADRQPDLHRLVRECAARLGRPLPPRIWLGPQAAVEGSVGRRGPGLAIGLPVAYSFSRAELSALIAHELAALAAAPSWADARRYRRWARAVDGLIGEEPHPPKTVRRLGPWAAIVERAADEAVEDATVAARAFLRLERIENDFLAFCTDVTDALSAVGVQRFGVSDLHDGWRRRLQVGAWPPDDDSIDGDEADLLGGRHPFLAAAARALVGQPMDLRPAPDPVEVAPLTGREQRQLASAGQSDRYYTRWRTFATVPPSMWRRDAARDGRRLRAEVAGVLGREPTGYAEAAEVIHTRPAEMLEAPSEEINIPVLERQCWLSLLEDRLLRQPGWGRTDPAILGVLRGPDGNTLDGRDLTSRAVTDPSAYQELLRRLSE